MTRFVHALKVQCQRFAARAGAVTRMSAPRTPGSALPEGFGDVPLVFVELVGGLGNQLFGFAAAAAQAHRLGGKVVMHHVSHQSDTPRGFALSGVTGDFACLGPTTLAHHEFMEGAFHYDPAINSIRDRTLLRGYFQSERYFGSHDRLRCHLSGAMNRARSESGSRGSLAPFIAVHVRGGDYRLPRNLRHHGMCSRDFYVNGVAEIRRRVGDLPVIIFSDDEKGFLMIEESVPHAHRYTGEGTADPFEVLADMATAVALVISNSTFGWWGAWLSGSRDVVAPHPWFSDSSIDARDLLPATWAARPR